MLVASQMRLDLSHVAENVHDVLARCMKHFAKPIHVASNE